MHVYYKEWKCTVAMNIEDTWEFFSRPENLEKMMPHDMGFEILSDIKGIEMYEGMLIRYRVSPLFGINMNWCTEITHIDPMKYFIDEQRFGPYAMWHHEHHFKEIDGGVEMTDKLHYAIPFGIFGRLANSILVDKKIEEIFATRSVFIANQLK